MSCDAWHELLIAFLDGEIKPEDQARLDSHLSGCAECREDLAELQTTSAALRRWEPAEPPYELVFVRRRERQFGRMLASFGRSALLPAGLGAALAAAAVIMVVGRQAPDPEVRDLAAEVQLLRDRLAAAESARSSEPLAAESVRPDAPGAEESRGQTAPASAGQLTVPVPAQSPAAVADLAPETRKWLLAAVDRLVRESESRQDAKLVLTADELARSLAFQRREDLSTMDRRLRDVQAETFEALVSTHERLNQMAPASVAPNRGERLEPR
jgi:hypothetical protein